MTTTNPIDEILRKLTTETKVDYKWRIENKDDSLDYRTDDYYNVNKARQALYSLLKERMPKENLTEKIYYNIDKLNFGKWSLETFGSYVGRVFKGETEGSYLRLKGYGKVYIISEKKYNHIYNQALAEVNKVIDELCGKEDKDERI